MTKNKLLGKRIFSCLLAMAVIMSMMPKMVWGGVDSTAVQTISDTQTESSVAEVAIQGGSTKYYDNIREAFAAADVEGQTATVKLLQNTVLDDSTAMGIQLSNGGIIALDLNGCTLSQKVQSNTQLYSATIVLDASYDSSSTKIDKAFLTIDDTSASQNGAIIQPNNAAAVCNDHGELTVKNGAIKTIDNDSYALYTLGKTYIQGGTIGAEGRNGLLTYPGVNVQLSGGTYSTIAGNNMSLDSMLATGYTFKYTDNSGFPDLTQSSVVGPVTVIPGSPGVSYKDADGNSQIKESTEFTYLTSSDSSAIYPVTLTSGWYAVKGDITIGGNVKAEDGVNLILCDNSNLTVNGQVILSGGLTIYGQGGDTGKMTVTASDISAFVTGENSTANAAFVRLYGGKLTATGGSKAFDDNVSLANDAQDKVKCIVTGSKPEQVADVHQNAYVTICKCTSHKWNYTPDETSGKHLKTCNLCGYNPNGENVAEYCTYDKFVSEGQAGHKQACICGNTNGDVIPHTSTEYTINDDGLTHSGTCDDCKAVLTNETHQFNESGVCACKAELKATYNNENYASLQAAINAAGSSGGIVTLKRFVNERVSITGGQSLMLDLNNNTLASAGVRVTDKGALTINSGNITLRNGRVYGASDTNAINAIVLAGGTLTLGESTIVEGGVQTIDGGQTIFSAIKIIDSNAVLNLNSGNVLLNGLEVPEGKVLADYLPDGCAFAKCNADGSLTNSENPELVNAYTNTDGTPCRSLIENLKVVEHTHSFTENNGYECACGFVCHHTDLDRTYKCTVCNTQMTVKITKDSQDSYAASLAAAIDAAASGSTLTLLSDNISAGGAITGGKSLTLDFNGKSFKADSSVIEVGASDTAVPGSTGNALTITGTSEDTYKGNSITVYGGNEFYTYDWSGTLNVFTANKNVTGSIDSGSFRTFKGNDVKWSTLIAADHTFYNLDGTSFAYFYYDTISSNIGNTKVMTCTHPSVESGYCVRCHKGPYAAETGGKYYATVAEAIEAANGGTVKLLANVSRSSLEIQEDFTLDLNGYNLVCNLTIISGTPKLINSAETGGKIDKLTISSDAKLSDLLSEEWAFKINNVWATEEELATAKTVQSVNVVRAPITSLTINGTNEAEYGHSNVTLTAGCAVQGVTFAWFKVKDDTATVIPDANSSSYTLPENLDAGTHTYRLTVTTSDGYSKSCDFTLTVKQASLSQADVTIIEEPTYNGTPQQPKIEVKMGETKLVEGTDYNIMSEPITACTLEYRTVLILEGMGNYTGYNTTATWQLKPATLTYTVTASPKKYDGTSKANVQVTFNYDENWIRLNEDDYTVTANYEDETAGENKEITGTVELKYPQIAIETTRNYILANGSFSTTGSITKNTVADPQPVSLVITNGVAKTYEVNLPALPELSEGCEYGDRTYIASVDFGENTGYYESGAKVENGILILPIEANQTKTTGEIGTVTVAVKTDNYEDITLTVNVSATNKLEPQLDGELTLTASEITYGDKLEDIGISGTMKVGDTEVDGTFAWQNPDTEPDANDAYSASWVFTPTDRDTYENVTGNATIIVRKATPTGKPYYENITESGKTLADAKLSVKDTDGNNLFKPVGEVAWKDGNDKSVEQGAKYEWVFTPTDTKNYETITGKIVLWARPASGGGAVMPPAADEDVITVKDEVASETTTKTTVKDTKTETVKNEQGEEISRITAKVSDKVADKLADAAVSNKSDTVEITVKSNDGNKAEQVEIEIPKKAVESIAKDTEADLVIKTDIGQVTLDNKTLETIAAEADGDNVKITINENTQLKEAQKPVLDIIGDKGHIFDLAAIIGGKYIHDFRGGRAHVTLPVPEKLKGKDVVVIYINDKGICEILNHTMETVGAEEYIKFTTSHFSNFAVVEKADAEKIIEKQNADKINSLIREAKLKATTSKTSKKNVKIKVSVKNNNSLIKEAKAMGYTVKYKFYRSTKKSSKYAVKATKKGSIYINTKGKKGTKYYYKAKVMVYDGKKLVAQTALKQCSYGARRWSK